MNELVFFHCFLARCTMVMALFHSFSSIRFHATPPSGEAATPTRCSYFPAQHSLRCVIHLYNLFFMIIFICCYYVRFSGASFLFYLQSFVSARVVDLFRTGPSNLCANLSNMVTTTRPSGSKIPYFQPCLVLVSYDVPVSCLGTHQNIFTACRLMAVRKMVVWLWPVNTSASRWHLVLEFDNEMLNIRNQPAVLSALNNINLG